MGRTVSVKLTADVSQYVSGLQRAKASTADFKQQLDKAAQKGKLDEVANGAGIAGLALAGMAAYAIKSAADFDKAMSAVSAATHASAGDIGKLRAAALQAGKDTQYSATQAADGITELSKAGVSTADVLNGGLKGALSLAAAGQLDVGEAAETAASAMTQFKLKGDQVPHVADLLAAAAGKAQGSVHDMGMALNQSGLVAAQFGLSIEDTTGALAEFASAGLLGSDAGTSLKTMLLAIANPSIQTRNLMASLGVSFYDAQGKFIGLSGVAQVLQTRMKGLTDEQRQQALGQIFGNDAIRAASILYTDGAKGVDLWKGKVNEAGYASETAAKLTDNLAGDIERLKGSVETLAIQSGSGANSGLRVLTKSLNDVVNGFLSLPAPVGATLTVLAGLGGALLLGTAAWIKYRKVVAEAQVQLAASGPAGEKAAGALGKVTGALGKVGMWAAAAEAASLLFNALDDKTADVDKLSASLENFATTGKSVGELNDVFGTGFDKLGRIAMFAESADHGLGHFLNTVVGSVPIVGSAGIAIGNFGSRLIAGTDFDTAKEQMSSLDSSMLKFMTTTNDARKASDLWNQVTAKSGLDTEQLAQLLPNTYKKLAELNTQMGVGGKMVNALGTATAATTSKTGDLNSALAEGTDAQKAYAGETVLAAAAARGERDALLSLGKALKSETEPVFGLLEAERALAAAQRDAAKATKEHGHNSDAARDANRKLALAAIEVQTAVGKLGDQFNGKMTPAMYATLRAAGLTERQIKDVATQFRDAKKDADKYAGKYEAKASAPGAKQAKKELDLAYTAANGFAGPYQAHVTVTGASAAERTLTRLSVYQNALKKGMPVGFNGPVRGPDGKYYADGGWTGPGSKYQPAGVVHADEFVIQKESRQKIEAKAPGLLEEMNATGQVPGYAGGGQVWPFPTTAGMTRIPSRSEVASAVTPSFGSWPPSPGAQRGDSGVWRSILAMVKASGIPYTFGNAYRPGDPLWHGCVPMDTRILTRRGWLTYDQVAVGEDETVGYNPTTGKNEWTLILGLHHYEDAELWTLENSQFRAEVTPGHKWLVDQQVTVQTETVCTECGREFATGRGMTTHRGHVHGMRTPPRVRFEEQLVATRDFKQTTRIHLAKPADLGEQLPITDDEAELIGWIFGDGYMEPYGPTIVQSKPEQVEYLRGFMAKFACSEYVRQPEGRQTFTIFRWKLSADYWHDLSSRSKASKEDALNFVFSLSPSQREAFLRGFLSADGTRDPRTEDPDLGYAAFQVSGPVAEAIKVAAYLEGYRPDTRVNTEFDDDRYGTQPMEHIGFRRSFMVSRKLPVVAKRTADVWCPTTTLGTWTARQGEEIFLTGNSGRAIDFMGYNQDRLAQFFLARQSKVLELIHRSNSRDYGITRGHYNAMPHQWPLHRNHLHIAMKAGGTITEPIMGVGASGRTYSFGENYQPERVVPNWQTDRSGGRAVSVNLTFSGPVGSQYELQNWLVGAFDDLKSRGRI